MSMTLTQDLLPTHPSRIRVHRLQQENLETVADRLLSDPEGPSVCGLSIRISKKDGCIDTIAFSTVTDVFSVSLDGERNLGSHGRAHLVRIFSDPYCTLAGFRMAHLALNIYRQWSTHVRGVDLSTLFAIDSAKPQSPADFASSRIHPDVSTEKINPLWYGDSIEDVYLRAWLSAVYVGFSVGTGWMDSLIREPDTAWQIILSTKYTVHSKSIPAALHTPSLFASLNCCGTWSCSKESARRKWRTNLME